MKIKGCANAIWPPSYQCGRPMTIYGPKDAFIVIWRCMTWQCSRCKILKIAQIQDDVNQYLPGVIIHVIRLNLSGKKLSSWIRKNIDKKNSYMAIRLDNETWVISNKQFNGSFRSNKRYFVNVTLPSLLSQITSRRRISSRFILKKKRKPMRKKPNSSLNFGFVSGDFEQTYNRLKTLYERAKWLSEHPFVKRTLEGNVLVSAFLQGKIPP